nr:sugar kinase [Clostridia bacterium]
MKKIVCFGELMLRLNPPGYDRILQTSTLEMHFGGTEANVAVLLSNLGQKVSFVTTLPENPIGQAAVNSVARYGVDVSDVVRGGNRTGIYFVEQGASQRNSKVIYDRKNSAVAEAAPESYNWREIFKGADRFHFTGITVAISENAAKACLDACEVAKEMGLKISCDLNYRSALWTEERAGEVMKKFVPYLDLLIANEEHADKLLGVRSENHEENEYEMLCDEACEEISRKLSETYGCRQVALTLRRTLSADDNYVGGTLYDKDRGFASARPFKVHIVDRIGSGDAFAAGLIYSDVQGLDVETSVNVGVAASALKHTIHGDYAIFSEAELLDAAKGKSDGRIKR